MANEIDTLFANMRSGPFSFMSSDPSSVVYETQSAGIFPQGFLDIFDGFSDDFVNYGVYNGAFAAAPSGGLDVAIDDESNPLPGWHGPFQDAGTGGSATLTASALAAQGKVLSLVLPNGATNDEIHFYQDVSIGGIGFIEDVNRTISIAQMFYFNNESVSANLVRTYKLQYLDVDGTLIGSSSSGSSSSTSSSTGVPWDWVAAGLPATAPPAKIRITIGAKISSGTTGGTVKISDVRTVRAFPAVLLADESGQNTTHRAGVIKQVDGILTMQPNGTSGKPLLTMAADSFTKITLAAANDYFLVETPGHLRLAEIAAPAAFGSAHYAIYPKTSDHRLYGQSYSGAGSVERLLDLTLAEVVAATAPIGGDYLVGTANATLTSEIVVGTTPGGELGGTWASPTIDSTHSGSAHADFIAKAFVNAKGDLITATANDTPAILTVGADDTMLMADAAAPSGLKWVASASPSAVGTAAAIGTADTFTRGDHVHAHETAHIAHDTLFDTAGDLVVGTGADTAGKLAITVPAANILNVLGVVNGETTWSVKSVHDGTNPAAIGTVAPGTSLLSAHRDHVHATGAGTPSTQAFGDAAATGSGPAAAMTDHKHAMPAVAITASGHTMATAKMLGRATAATGAIEEIATTGTGNAMLSASPTTTGTLTAAAITASGLITANANIAFPAVVVDSANANTLDDYEEGTFTPALAYATVGSSTWAITTQVGWYTKIGNVVLYTLFYQGVPTNGTGAGNLKLTGLPFTSVNTANEQHQNACNIQGYTKANYTSPTLQILLNTTTAQFSVCGSAQTNANLAVGDIPSAGTVIVRSSGLYMTT